ncbi:MAG TPA: phytanoyl-CoA dioxygenase family protein [Rhizomicrobium sp.]|jgi:hypothetical protein
MSSAASLKTQDWDGTFPGALTWAGMRDDSIGAAECAAFEKDGYVILRDALPTDWLEPLRDIFERTVTDKWPFPREDGTRFAMVDNDPHVRRACLLPCILAAVRHMMRRRFHFAGVQGRDPGPDGGEQRLHRDWAENSGQTAVISGFIFLDDFDAENGATLVVPGTHRDAPGSGEIVLSGRAGDILLLDAYLLHRGTRNTGTRTRRSIHLVYRAHELFGTGLTAWDLSKVRAEERCLMGHDT